MNMGNKSAPAFIERAEPSADVLEKIRQKLREARDAERRMSDMSESLKEQTKLLQGLRHETLPDLFIDAGIDNLGIPAEGNLPGYDFELKPFYRANIAADWPQERRKQAFDFLEQRGDGDLIKTTIVVLIPRDQRAKAKKVESALKKLKVNYEIDLSVPWGTLTAWIKEQIEKHDATLPLETLGAQVGTVVKMTQRKS
jgi:hypothetical protein